MRAAHFEKRHAQAACLCPARAVPDHPWAKEKGLTKAAKLSTIITKEDR